MRRLIINLIMLSMIIGLGCRNNPVEEPPSEVPAAIALSANNSTILIGGETTEIYAYILGEDGDTLGAGHEIRFEITDAPATSGPGSPSFEYIAFEDSVLLEVAAVTNSNGRASTMLYSGTEIGDVTIKATYSGNDEIITEETLITILAYTQPQFNLSVAYPSIPRGGASTTIYASILDEAGVPISDSHEVIFEITEAPSFIGEESPSFEFQATGDSALHIFEAVTEIGLAEAVLYSGTLAGTVRVRAAISIDDESYSDTAQIVIASENLYYIELTAADSTIEVGYQSTMIRAALHDWRGEPSGEGYEIRLEVIVSPHGGLSFTLPGGDQLSVIDTTDSEGAINVEFYSGIRTGMVIIRATALFDTTIFVDRLLFNILPGPPTDIVIYTSNTADESNDLNRTGITARVWDQYTNTVKIPVDEPVFFDLIADNTAVIDSLAYADPIGTISAWIYYDCPYTFDTVRVITDIGMLIDTSDAIVLPIYDGYIAVSARPSRIYLDNYDNPEFSEIGVQLINGFG